MAEPRRLFTMFDFIGLYGPACVVGWWLGRQWDASAIGLAAGFALATVVLLIGILRSSANDPPEPTDSNPEVR